MSIQNKTGLNVTVIGEILFDIFTAKQKEVMGGAPFNFAFHVHRLNHRVQFISRVGTDEYGQRIKSMLQRREFLTSGIQTDDTYPTGQVRVTFSDSRIPDYEIVKPVAYDFIDYDEAAYSISQKSDVDLIYFGTLCQRESTSRDTIRRIIKDNENAQCFYDINLRPPHYNRDIIEESLVLTDILKVNDDELDHICSLMSVEGTGHKQVDNIMNRYNIGTVCVTLGEKGSQLYQQDQYVECPINESVNVIDTVGAGDAYAAVLALGLLQNVAPETIIKAASEFAGLICQQDGAIPDDDKLYTHLAQAYPEWLS